MTSRVTVAIVRVGLALGVAGIGTVASMLALVGMVDEPTAGVAPRRQAAVFEIVAPPQDDAPIEPTIESVVPTALPTPTTPAPTRTLARAPSAISATGTPTLGSSLSDLPALGSGMPIATGLPTTGAPGMPTLAEVEPDTPARPVSRPAPRYPRSAQQAGIEGAVVVRLRIDERGRVVDVVVVDASPKGVFDDVAIAAAKSYRFAAAKRDGKAVATTVEQRVVFRLGR